MRIVIIVMLVMTACSSKPLTERERCEAANEAFIEKTKAKMVEELYQGQDLDEDQIARRWQMYADAKGYVMYSDSGCDK